MMTDVLLIHPPYAWPKKSHPLGLAYIASVLEQDGFTVQIIDMDPMGMSIADLRGELIKIRPKIAGISFMTPQCNYAVEILKIIKKVDPNIKTVAGGSHVSALPKEMLDVHQLDFAVIGEGEYTARELVAFLMGKSKLELEDVKGIAFIKNGKYILNKPRDLISDLNRLPFPAWHLLPMDRYSVENLGGKKREPVYPLLSNRGCPNQCIFCSSHVVFQRKFRQRSDENVIAEVEFLNREYGATQFDFIDDTVTVNKKRMGSLCSYFTSLPQKYLWMCNSRVNTVTKELLVSMYKAGCRRIDFGVESGNQDILNNIKKGITLEQVVNAHRWAKEAGLTVSSFFMVGNLGETEEHINRTVDFIDKLDTDYASATIATPFPGTELFSVADSNGWIYERDWSKYDTTALISKNYMPVARNDRMDRGQLLKMYFFLNSRISRKKLKSKYGRLYLLNYRFYCEQLFARMNHLGFLQTVKLAFKLRPGQ
jgi:anaerobic magnesium-protoporphyrin IX monomethyl ester cyclase